MKIRPVGAELFHANGQTENMTKLIVAFLNFADAPNIFYLLIGFYNRDKVCLLRGTT